MDVQPKQYISIWLGFDSEKYINGLPHSVLQYRARD